MLLNDWYQTFLASRNLEFEQAAKTRDLIHDLKSKLFGI